jgi:hypothetical protein
MPKPKGTVADRWPAPDARRLLARPTGLERAYELGRAAMDPAGTINGRTHAEVVALCEGAARRQTEIASGGEVTFEAARLPRRLWGHIPGVGWDSTLRLHADNTMTLEEP